MNVEKGWNKKRGVYIPNGSGTLHHTRREGGNWKEGKMSPQCRITSVMSKGKRRVVSVYAERNTAVLTPIHQSLYRQLSKRSWLLVGDVTEDHVAELGEGKKISIDYSQATDNIKRRYCSAAVEILIEQGEGLTKEEVTALNIFANLMIEGEEGKYQRGQPMGSAMSFPILCLINKTCVDLSLAALMERGELDIREWTNHRCKINGDDLLLNDVRRGGLREEIRKQGLEIGLEVNIEKSMESEKECEMNSQLFINGKKQKKVNYRAVKMSDECADVIGMAAESTRTMKGFVKCVRLNSDRLKQQKVKNGYKVKRKHYIRLLKEKKVVDAICSQPIGKLKRDKNPFPIVDKPEVYRLSREEERQVIDSEVARLRLQGFVKYKGKKEKFSTFHSKKYWQALMVKGRSRTGTILKCLYEASETKGWEELASDEVCFIEAPQYQRVSDQSHAQDLIDMIRTSGVVRPKPKRVDPPDEEDFIAFT